VRRSLLEGLPGAGEGELTRRKIALVRTESLAAGARRIGLEGFIEAGAGLSSSTGRLPRSVMAGTMEALLGAAFLDGGLEAARAVMDAAGLVAGAGEEVPVSPKSELQELVQAGGGGAPVYRVVGRRGPDHRPEFTVEVLVDEESVALGRGGSIGEAESDAAGKAVAVIKREERRGLPPFRGS
jgi:ribonuclease-3